jgi:hypothetical protein
MRYKWVRYILKENLLFHKSFFHNSLWFLRLEYQSNNLQDKNSFEAIKLKYWNQQK